MPQTLLALCALLIFSFFALNRHRDDAAFERTTVTAEVEGAVSEVARGRISDLERLAFDEQDVGRSNIRLVAPTSVIGPDATETGAAAFDDIDDYNGLVEQRTAAAGSGVLRFTVTYAVRYVVPTTFAASAVPTLAKEVHVRATEITTGRTDRPAVAVSLRKVFTPAGMTSYRR